MPNTISLPRMNSNILALTSFILICMMMFLTVQPALAWNCDELKKQMDLAKGLADLAKWAVDQALAAYLWALDNGNETLIRITGYLLDPS